MITRHAFYTDFTDSAEKICGTLCADVATNDLLRVSARGRRGPRATNISRADQSGGLNSRHRFRLRYASPRTIHYDDSDHVWSRSGHAHHALRDESAVAAGRNRERRYR